LAELEKMQKENGNHTLYDTLSLEHLSELSYLQMCLNEAMRIEAPLSRSTSMMMTEDVSIGKYTLKKEDIFIIDMYQVMRNPS